MTVDYHEAAAAGAFGCAAVLRRHHTELLAQHLEEIHPRLVGGRNRPSVHIHVDPGHFGSVYHRAGSDSPDAPMDQPWKTDRWFVSPWCYLPEGRQYDQTRATTSRFTTIQALLSSTPA